MTVLDIFDGFPTLMKAARENLRGLDDLLSSISGLIFAQCECVFVGPVGEQYLRDK